MSDLIRTVARWAAGQSDVRAVALVGSYARGTTSVDSDVDVVLVVDDVGRRLGSRSWVAEFGEVCDIEEEDWGLVQSLRVHYRDGREVEFGLAPVEWATPPLDEGTSAVIRAGLSVVFDPDGMLTRAERASGGHRRSTV